MSDPDIDLSGESSEDLVEMTTWSDDSRAARAARAELWGRFRRYVWVACNRAFRGEFSRDQLKDLVVDTFVRACGRADTFKNENLQDKDRAFRKVGAWLCQIAKNLAADLRRAGATGIATFELQETDQLRRPASARLGPLSVRIEQALATPGVLNDKEIIVLREWAQHYDAEADSQRFPDGVTSDLAQQLNVQPESIRQILGRGLKKLEAWLKSESDLAGAKAQ